MKKWMERCFFSTRDGIFPFIVSMIMVLQPICTLTWSANNFIYRQGRSIIRRNERTIIIMYMFLIVLINTFVSQLTVNDWKLVLN